LLCDHGDQSVLICSPCSTKGSPHHPEAVARRNWLPEDSTQVCHLPASASGCAWAVSKLTTRAVISTVALLTTLEKRHVRTLTRTDPLSLSASGSYMLGVKQEPAMRTVLASFITEWESVKLLLQGQLDRLDASAPETVSLNEQEAAKLRERIGRAINQVNSLISEYDAGRT
jgi:hypothetical protein